MHKGPSLPVGRQGFLASGESAGAERIRGSKGTMTIPFQGLYALIYKSIYK
jgi:hypothetical protein